MNEYDVVIIGAGVAGSCAARVAHERGLTACIVSDPDAPPAASRAAIGVISGHNHYLKHNKANWTLQAARTTRSIACWRTWGLLCSDTALTSDWRAPSVALVKDGYYVVDVDRALLQPDYLGRALRVEQQRVWMNGWAHPLTARYGVIVAAGPSAPLFGVPILKQSFGATLVYDGLAPAERQTAYRYRSTPYSSMTLMFNGRTLRVGSSDVTKIEQAVGRLDAHVQKLPGQLQSLLPLGIEPVYRVGQRVNTASLETPWNPLYDGRVVHVTGLGKLGYALAPAAAHEVIEYFLQRGAVALE